MPSKKDQSRVRKQIEQSLEKTANGRLPAAARDRALYLQAVHDTLEWTLGDVDSKEFRGWMDRQVTALDSSTAAVPAATGPSKAAVLAPLPEWAIGEREEAVEAPEDAPLESGNFFQRQINKLDALDWRIKAQLTIGFALAVVIPFYLFRQELQALGDWGYLGAFLINLLSNATIILPAPGAIVIALMAQDFNPLLIGVAAGVGGTIGGMSSYVAGAINVNSSEGSRWSRPLRWIMARAGIPVLFVFGAVPLMPGDVASIVAGSVRYPIVKYLIVTGLANIVKMSIIAYLGVDGLEWLQDTVTLWMQDIMSNVRR